MRLHIYVLMYAYCITIITCFIKQQYVMKSSTSTTINYTNYYKINKRTLLSLLKDSNDIDSIPSSSSSSSSSIINNANVNIDIPEIPPSKSEIWKSRAILLIVSAFYGTNFGCVKILGDSLDSGVAAAIRFFIAFLVFSPQLFKVIKTNPKLITGGFEIGFYTFLGYWAQSNALQTSSASTVAFICSLQVVIVPLIDLIIDKNRRNIPTIIETLLPALLAVAGVACLELGGSVVPGRGDLWALIQPLTFGFAFWRIERIMKLSTKPGEAQAFTAASLMIVFLMSCFWAFSSFIFPILHNTASDGSSSSLGIDKHTQDQLFIAIHQQIDAITSNWKVIAALLWTGIMTTAITTFGENIAMKTLNAAESTVIYSTEPLWGTAFAAVTLGETIGWNTALGALFIISACAWRSVSVQVAGVITTIQISYLQGFEEVSENIIVNFMKILEEIFGTSPR